MDSQAVVVAGVPGSGKTTFGQGLARRWRFAYLDLDTVTNPLYELVGGGFTVDVAAADPPSAMSVNDIRYRCLLDTAAENLELGASVVLVAPFTSERTYARRWAWLLSQLRIGPQRASLAWVDTPRDEILRRIARRGAARDFDKLSEPDRYFGPDLLAPPGIAHYRVNGMLTVAAQVEGYIQHRFREPVQPHDDHRESDT